MCIGGGLKTILANVGAANGRCFGMASRMGNLQRLGIGIRSVVRRGGVRNE